MIHVRNRKPRQNLQAFAAGGGVAGGGQQATGTPNYGNSLGQAVAIGTPSSSYGIPPVASPVNSKAGNAGNYITPPNQQATNTPQASYSPIASTPGAPTATAQGLPGARPAVGYTQGPQSNRFGSWGQQAEGGGYNPVAGNAPQAIPQSSGPTYQRASTRGTYGSYTLPPPPPPASYSYTPPPPPARAVAVPIRQTPIAAGAAPVILHGDYYTVGGTNRTMAWEPMDPRNPLKAGTVAEWAGYAAAGGAIPAMEDGGTVPDPGGAIPETDPGEGAVDQSDQQNDPVASAQAALSAARKANGLNDEVFNQLWAMNSGMPSRPAGPGGDQLNPNPFPTKTPNPPFGKRMAMNMADLRPSTNVEDNRNLNFENTDPEAGATALGNPSSVPLPKPKPGVPLPRSRPRSAIPSDTENT